MLVLMESMSHPQLSAAMRLYANSRERDRIGDARAVYEFFLDFFSQKDAFCAGWVTEDGMCSVLRIQHYTDGVLLTGVETAPLQRSRGHAYALICTVLAHLRQRGVRKVYSHVDRKNIPSLKLHEKCGFYKLRDTARLLYGSVTAKMDTLCIEL